VPQQSPKICSPLCHVYSGNIFISQPTALLDRNRLLGDRCQEPAQWPFYRRKHEIWWGKIIIEKPGANLKN
jgi:hypothetical protein